MIPAGIITIFAAVLRFINLNWDAGGRLHPDEALIVNGALTLRFFSQMFPGFHDYNGLPVYLLHIFSHIASWISGSAWWSQSAEGVTLAGRFLSALLSTLSVPLIIILGKKLYSIHTGLIAGLILAAIPLLIQLAHFYTTESMLIFLSLLLLLACAAYIRVPSLRNVLIMSVSAGLMLATKNTSYLVLPIPLAALILHRRYRSLIPFMLFSLMTFFLASPYSFLDAGGYLARYRYLADVVSGRLLMDWTLQFTDTTPFFWIPNLLYAFGPAILTGITAAVFTIRYTTKKTLYITILSVWFIGFLVFSGITYLKFVRYSTLLAPLAALLSAALIHRLRRYRAGRFATLAFLVFQILWSAMVSQLYFRNHTSLEAASWLESHIPYGTVILTEEWNSIIRFNRAPLSDNGYGFHTINFYMPETDLKIQALMHALNESDVIVLESPKVKNTIHRLSDRYPETVRIYTNLENGSLGFGKVAEFTSYPSLGPLIVPDHWLEETWYAFDHPAITVYARAGVVLY